MIVKPTNVGRGQSNTLPYLPNPSGTIAQSMFWMTAMPLQFTLFNQATAITTGQADPFSEVNVLGRNLHAVAVSATGTYAATVLVEATLDGVNWFTLDTITATGIKQYSGLYQSIRASITVYTSGTITVTAITQRT